MHCTKIKLSDGKERWVCVADAPADLTTGKRKQISRRGKSKREAKEAVENVLSALKEGYNIRDGKKITFAQIADEWYTQYKFENNKSTTNFLKEYALELLKNRIGSIPIANITLSKYQKLINDLSETYSRNTVASINVTGGQIFKYALLDKIIKDNPKNGVVLPKKKLTIEDIENESIEHKYLENEEVAQILKAAKENGRDNDYEIFHVLSFTGMRSSELCALKWSDIDFENKTIKITKTHYSRSKRANEYELTTPKTLKSIRTITINEFLIDLLKQLKMRQFKKLTERRKKDHTFFYHDENFIFCNRHGYPYNNVVIVNKLKYLLPFTTITKKVTPHFFRHSHISMMTEAGVDLQSIMERVGHDNAATTLKIYTHVTNKMREKTNDKLKNLFEDILEKTKI